MLCRWHISRRPPIGTIARRDGHAFILFDTRSAVAASRGRAGSSPSCFPRAASASAARMRRRVPDAREAPPADVRHALDSVVALLRGEPVDLTGVRLMDRVAPFEDASTIGAHDPLGSSSSYGEIASRLGDRGAARDVGQALGRIPSSSRVIASSPPAASSAGSLPGAASRRSCGCSRSRVLR
jgi:methylated-DNA-[protein]-cysteine S-methyltransferase